MDNINFGIVKYSIINKSINNFITESNSVLNDDSAKFIKLVANNPILKEQFNVYDSIENAFIENGLIAVEFVNENISKFNSFDSKSKNDADQLLKEFAKNIEINNGKVDLYEAINVLINYEVGIPTDIINKTNAKIAVVEYITKNKIEPKVDNSDASLLDNINESVYNIAVDLFNEKYSSFDENQKDLFSKIISEDFSNEKLFDDIKSQTIQLLENQKTDEIANQINEAIDQIKLMEFNENNAINDILKVNQLKSDLS